MGFFDFINDEIFKPIGTGQKLVKAAQQLIKIQQEEDEDEWGNLGWKDWIEEPAVTPPWQAPAPPPPVFNWPPPAESIIPQGIPEDVAFGTSDAGWSPEWFQTTTPQPTQSTSPTGSAISKVFQNMGAKLGAALTPPPPAPAPNWGIGGQATLNASVPAPEPAWDVQLPNWMQTPQPTPTPFVGQKSSLYDYNPQAWQDVEDYRSVTPGQRADTSAGIEWLGLQPPPPPVFGIGAQAGGPAQLQPQFGSLKDLGFQQENQSLLGGALSDIGSVFKAEQTAMAPFKELGADLTPLVADIYAQEFVPNLLGKVPVVGDELATAAKVSNYLSPLGPLALAGDVAEKAGIYKPNTGYDDIGSSLSNVRESGGNPWEFAKLQEQDLSERPLVQQLGAEIYSPDNILGSGLFKGSGVPTWLTRADDIADTLQGGKILGPVLGMGARTVGPELIGAGAGVAANEFLVPEDQQLPWWAAAGLGATGTAAIRRAPQIAKGIDWQNDLLRNTFKIEPELGAVRLGGPGGEDAAEAILRAAGPEQVDAIEKMVADPLMRQAINDAAVAQNVQSPVELARLLTDPEDPVAVAFRETVQRQVPVQPSLLEPPTAQTGTVRPAISDPKNLEFGVDIPTEITPGGAATGSTLRRTQVEGKEIPLDAEHRNMLEALKDERRIRESGLTAEEIHEGRVVNAAQFEQDFNAAYRAGYRGQELLDAVSLNSGPLRQTFADISKVSTEDWDSAAETIASKFREKHLSQYETAGLSDALRRFRDGGSLEPQERKDLWAILGGPMAEKIGIASRTVDTTIKDPAPTLIFPGWGEQVGRLRLVEPEAIPSGKPRFRSAPVGEGILPPSQTPEGIMGRKANTLVNEFWDGTVKTRAMLDGIDPNAKATVAAVRGTLDTKLTHELAKARTRLSRMLVINGFSVDVADDIAEQQVRGYLNQRFPIDPLRPNEALENAYDRTITQLNLSFRVPQTQVDQKLFEQRAAELFADDVKKGRFHYIQTRGGQIPSSWKGLSEKQRQEFFNRHEILGRKEYKGIEALQHATQVSKNTAFGLLDIAAIGQNALSTASSYANYILTTAARVFGQIPAGQSDDISRKSQWVAAGLLEKTPSGAVQNAEETGSLLRYIPYTGTRAEDVDRWIARHYVEPTVKLQYDIIMGGARRAQAEGNMVLLKLLGFSEDDPRTWRAAADFANSHTLAADLATARSRNGLESAVATTAMQTRAQGNKILQVAKLFGIDVPIGSGKKFTIGVKATPQERVLAAWTILQQASSVAIAGAVINGTNGFGSGAEFQWNPGEPDFGMLSMPDPFGDGRINVQLFPQKQVERALISSFNIIRESDEKTLAETLKEFERLGTRFTLGRASPPIQSVAKAAGAGYDPVADRWDYRNYGSEMSIKDRLTSLVPLPPIVQDAILGKPELRNPMLTALNLAGFNSYPERPFDAALRNYSRESGQKFESLEDMNALEKTRFLNRYGDAIFENDDALSIALAHADKMATDAATGFSAGNLTRDEFRDSLDTASALRNAAFESFATESGQAQPKFEEDKWFYRYYDTFELASSENGELDGAKLGELQSAFWGEVAKEPNADEIRKFIYQAQAEKKQSEPERRYFEDKIRLSGYDPETGKQLVGSADAGPFAGEPLPDFFKLAYEDRFLWEAQPNSVSREWENEYQQWRQTVANQKDMAAAIASPSFTEIDIKSIWLSEKGVDLNSPEAADFLRYGMDRYQTPLYQAYIDAFPWAQWLISGAKQGSDALSYQQLLEKLNRPAPVTTAQSSTPATPATSPTSTAPSGNPYLPKTLK